MPTKVKWIGAGLSQLRGNKSTGELEDHIAEIWAKRGLVQIIGGFLFDQKNPKPDVVVAKTANDPERSTKSVEKSPRTK